MEVHFVLPRELFLGAFTLSSQGSCIKSTEHTYISHLWLLGWQEQEFSNVFWQLRVYPPELAVVVSLLLLLVTYGIREGLHHHSILKERTGHTPAWVPVDTSTFHYVLLHAMAAYLFTLVFQLFTWISEDFFSQSRHLQNISVLIFRKQSINHFRIDSRFLCKQLIIVDSESTLTIVQNFRL